MKKSTETLLYWGIGITGFLALMTSQKGNLPKPPPKYPDIKLVRFQTESNGQVLVSAIDTTDWKKPLLKPEVHNAFKSMMTQWHDLVQEASLDYNVPESWIWAIMWSESKGDPRAKSGAGALGLMQVMPFHFKSGEDPFDPRTNIRAGVRYMQTGRSKVSDLVRLASFYNAGGPWTNESWKEAHRRPEYITKWGYPADAGYIDSVVAANNTYHNLGVGVVSA